MQALLRDVLRRLHIQDITEYGLQVEGKSSKHFHYYVQVNSSDWINLDVPLCSQSVSETEVLILKKKFVSYDSGPQGQTKTFSVQVLPFSCIYSFMQGKSQ